MKYYAVTEDPNELLHYGVKGMKWGQHLFAKEKSPGYKRAASKLSKNMRNGIASKVAHWKKAPSDAVLRAKAKLKAQKQEFKAYRKEQKFMKKSLQRAREGRLKYGKLTDAEVMRVTERLSLEQRARQLGNTEKPKFRKRMKEAIQEGLLRGTTQGSAAYVEERLRARGKYKAMKKYGAKQAVAEAKAQAKKNKALDKAEYKLERKTAWRDAKMEQEKEFYKQKAEAGERRAIYQMKINPFAGHARRVYAVNQNKLSAQNAEQKKMAEEDRKQRMALYERYVSGGKNGGGDSVLTRFSDRNARERFLNPSFEKTEIKRVAAKATAEYRRAKQSNKGVIWRARRKRTNYYIP